MVKNYFIVTKPLQYVNALNIGVDNQKHLIIVNAFVNSLEFYSAVKKLTFWDSIDYFNTFVEAYKFLKVSVKKEDSVFIDSDYGLLKAFWLFKIKSRNIYVYEEGLGSYRNNLLSRNNRHGIVNSILKSLGVKEYFGGSRFVRGLYLYDHAKHKSSVVDFKKELYKFKNSFLDNLELYKSHFDYQSHEIKKLIGSIPIDHRVNIYLTTYEYNSNIERYLLERSNEYWMIKPHPHITSFQNRLLFNQNIPPYVFIELLLLELLTCEIDFTIFHEGSSVLHYFPNVDNVLIGYIP